MLYEVILYQIATPSLFTASNLPLVGNTSKFATNSVFAVIVAVYGFSVETISPFTVQFTNLYPSFGIAVKVTVSPSLTFVTEASAVPIVSSDDDTDIV